MNVTGRARRRLLQIWHTSQNSGLHSTTGAQQALPLSQGTKKVFGCLRRVEKRPKREEFGATCGFADLGRPHASAVNDRSAQ